MATTAAVTTFLPRSEEVISATREWERGRRSKEDVDTLYQKWTHEVLRFEEEQGFGWKTGGHLAWHDLFRPLIGASQGIAVGALTRWFETNTFYRRPVIEELPQFVPGKLASYLPQSSDLVVILPGPWTLAGLAENRTGRRESEVAESLAHLLHSVIAELSAEGERRFLFHEPLLAYAGEAPEDELQKLYGIVTAGGIPAQFLMWTYFGDGSWIVPEAPRLGVSMVGVDLSETPLGELTRSRVPSGVALGLGCIDPRTSLPESQEDIAQLVHEVDSKLHPGSMVLGPAAPMDLLPWETAREKLSVLRHFAGRSG